MCTVFGVKNQSLVLPVFVSFVSRCQGFIIIFR